METETTGCSASQEISNILWNLKVHYWRPLWPSCQFLATVPEVRVRFLALPDFPKIRGLKRSPFSLVSATEELLEGKSSSSGLESRNTAVGIRRAAHVAPSTCKVGTNFYDKRRSLGQYGLLTDSGHRKFITVFTGANQWSLFWARWIHSTLSHPSFLNLHFNTPSSTWRSS
jgi:hypothetical protein